ncbi:hypothetical protein SAMD00079811_64410 [Scytonema sp. HK-05]|nr:hypothetical protein SAMD00079811_64410 [Scytonema sp. HK-05]
MNEVDPFEEQICGHGTGKSDSCLVLEDDGGNHKLVSLS